MLSLPCFVVYYYSIFLSQQPRKMYFWLLFVIVSRMHQTNAQSEISNKCRIITEWKRSALNNTIADVRVDVESAQFVSSSNRYGEQSTFLYVSYTSENLYRLSSRVAGDCVIVNHYSILKYCLSLYMYTFFLLKNAFWTLIFSILAYVHFCHNMILRADNR